MQGSGGKQHLCAPLSRQGQGNIWHRIPFAICVLYSLLFPVLISLLLPSSLPYLSFVSLSRGPHNYSSALKIMLWL